MTEREQWKALRAPIIQKAWAIRTEFNGFIRDDRQASRFLVRGMIDKVVNFPNNPVVRLIRRQDGAGQFLVYHSQLREMRAAEREGQLALLWKLTWSRG